VVDPDGVVGGDSSQPSVARLSATAKARAYTRTAYRENHSVDRIGK
jgi:hypothetical protein